MSVQPNPAATTRRRFLGSAAFAGLAATPVAALLNACATGDGDTGAQPAGGGSPAPSPTGATADNPFGFAPDSQIDAVFFAGGFGTEYPNALKAEFEKRYPQSTVGVTTTTTIATEMQPRFAGGNPPDFLNNSGDDSLALDGLVRDGAVHSLEELLNAPSLDDPNVKIGDTLVNGIRTAGSFGGELYAMPLVNSTYGIWYNATLFRDNGWTPPTNWSEFLTLADKMLAAGVAPFINGNTTAHWYLFNVLMEWINIQGGDEAVIAIDNLEPGAWHQPAVVTAAGRMKELVDSGLTYPGMDGLNHIQAQQAWLDGEAGLLWCGTWLENEMSNPETLEENGVTDGGIPEDFEMTMMAPWAPSDNPALPPGCVRVLPGELFVVPEAGANRPGGLELLRVMLTKAYARQFIELTSSATVVKGTSESFESEALKSAFAVAEAAPDNLLWRWYTWYQAQMYTDTMQPLIVELMAGRIEPEELLNSMQEAADKVAADDSIEKFTREV